MAITSPVLHQTPLYQPPLYQTLLYQTCAFSGISSTISSS